MKTSKNRDTPHEGVTQQKREDGSRTMSVSVPSLSLSCCFSIPFEVGFETSERAAATESIQFRVAMKSRRRERRAHTPFFFVCMRFGKQKKERERQVSAGRCLCLCLLFLSRRRGASYRERDM
jgi:hypothetical protein